MTGEVRVGRSTLYVFPPGTVFPPGAMDGQADLAQARPVGALKDFKFTPAPNPFFDGFAEFGRRLSETFRPITATFEMLGESLNALLSAFGLDLPEATHRDQRHTDRLGNRWKVVGGKRGKPLSWRQVGPHRDRWWT